MTDKALTDLTALELRDVLRRGELSVTEVTETFVERVTGHDEFGAFVEHTPELALERARELDARGDREGVIFGMPSADKDLQDRAGVRSRYGSMAFQQFEHRPAESDAVVQQLDAQGMVSLGKTATPEFGFHGYTSSLATGHTTIPGHPDLGAGGSSGGAAAAVAGRLLPFAPGSDAGGSVRIPAAACGLVGIKPGRGRVPALSGQGALGQLPVAGALGRNVADAALLMDALIEGAPQLTALQAPPLSGTMLGAAQRADASPQRIAVLEGEGPWAETYDIEISPEAKAAVDAAVAELTALGHEVETVRMPELPGYDQHFVTLWHANAASLPVPPELFPLFEPLTQTFIESGRTKQPHEIVAAVAYMHRFELAVAQAFAPYAAVLTPTTALPPRPVGWHGDDPAENFKRQCQYTPHTSFVNVAGLPALTLPTYDLGQGLTMGTQLIGRAGGEHEIITLAAQLEQRLSFAG